MRLSAPSLLLALALALPVSPALAQAPVIPNDQGAVVDELKRKALAGSGAYELVESLTTEVGPRLVGTPGDARAVAWAVAKLKALGYDRVWTEPVEVAGWIRGAEVAEVTAPFPQGLVITALGGSVATPPGGVEAEIAWFPTYDDLLAAPPGSLTGKIAVVGQRMVKMQSGGGYGYAVRMRGSGASEAAKRGAVALLIRSVGTHDHRFPHTGAMRYADGVEKIPAAALSPPDADQIERMVARGRPVRVRLTLTPEFPGPVTTHNVIAELKGATAPQEIVLLAAHLDSWDQGTGAVDDGAGVAMVMATGKLIRDVGKRPRRTLRVVLYGAEEVGLVGADAYARAHADEMENHIIGTEADFGAGPVYAFGMRVSPASKAATDVILRHLAPLGIAPSRALAAGGPDLIVLRRAGMPVVDLLLDGTDYFDVHHTPDDTLARVDRAKLDQATAAHAVFAWLALQGTGSFRPIPQD